MVYFLQRLLTFFHFSFQSEGVSFLTMTSNNRVQHSKKLLGIYILSCFEFFCWWFVFVFVFFFFVTEAA